MMARYIDEHGTVTYGNTLSKEDIDYSTALNQAKSVAEQKRNNDLYVKELKIIKRNGMITLVTSIIAALTAIFSVFLQLCAK